MRRIDRSQLEQLCHLAQRDGRTLIGPTVRDGAIALAPITTAADLPVGWTDVQAPGRYRLSRTQGQRAFDFVVGPNSAKEQFFKPREPLYRAERRADGRVGFVAIVPEPEKRALLGVRACDLAAIAVQDAVFVEGAMRDPRYASRRADTLVIAVHCTRAGSLCFCASMGTGPKVNSGADLALAEREHDLLIEALTPAGEALLAQLSSEEASGEDLRWLDESVESARASMGRHVDTRAVHERLFAQLEHPRWKEVADRCLSCGNCTSVCPTCFCSTTEDRSDLDGSTAERDRLWESCFSREHSELHGHAVRGSTEQRYRQWLTHKLGAWVSQFGASGCVGCGRCIAWCPAGIDLTEELAALSTSDARALMPVAAPCAEEGRDEAMVPSPARVLSVTRESSDVVTLALAIDEPRPFAPGQFYQLSIPGIGEAPISVSGRDGAGVEHTIRAVGSLTRALCELSPGSELGVRGPYGRGWPMRELAGAPVVVVAGGIGLAPLREALRQMLADPQQYPDVRLFYGARTPEDLLYAREMLGWTDRRGFQLSITVDRSSPTWRGNVGVVTRLLKRSTVPDAARAILCGPEVMMRFTIQALARLGVTHDRIWLTMERHMKCATGHCGRCQFGPYFVCKDGPVFRYDEVASLFGRDGI